MSDLQKCECGVELPAAALFCHRCGKKVPMTRSGQEIRAEMKRLEDIARSEGTHLSIGMAAMTLRTALAWAVGDLPVSLAAAVVDSDKIHRAIADAVRKVKEDGNADPHS